MSDAVPTGPARDGHGGWPADGRGEAADRAGLLRILERLAPVRARAGTIVVYGGSFDPAHLGHLAIARAALAQCGGEGGEAGKGGQGFGPAALLFVPASRSPHKLRGPIASDGARLEMLGLLIGACPEGRRGEAMAVWPAELERAKASPGAASFTVETLAELRGMLDASLCAQVRLRLLIGGDQAAALHAWRSPRRIVELARPLIYLREPVGSAGALAGALGATHFWSDREIADLCTGRLVGAALLEESSTAAREAAGAGDWGTLERLVGAAVAGYVRERGLYPGAAGQ